MCISSFRGALPKSMYFLPGWVFFLPGGGLAFFEIAQAHTMRKCAGPHLGRVTQSPTLANPQNYGRIFGLLMQTCSENKFWGTDMLAVLASKNDGNLASSAEFPSFPRVFSRPW